ncbi:hypothetical protein CWRG_01576 [Chthonomonas calidirosea]|uniref:Uncharacterized protein n=1 Tax=Chthonomonas calidirosea (strain DSM 23976 / ICMP 18418 / T49) TaxID=1303518 RepID=S0EX15_CHTCT|nr:hypothetical protein [Chthonomonas calidirosea]CCW36296.1 hypothetical protein CCALI_02499 [Chthonomonas calidirosea T49]CEK16684.1 hypothetical protein CP488_01591 [Chthonomonas calidirosea]CEK16691.1 hypothetical protein CWRG_01576 [Chthonomonas calidirosea]CEK17752.1 hypothetical protein CTKA_01592 [Chthonomonas calidirosea]
MSSQPASAPKEENNQEDDIALLIRRHNLSLTEVQRSLLPKQLQELEDTITALRKFPLQDGASEPATLLLLLPLGHRRS